MAVPPAYRGREQSYIKHTLLTKYLDRLGHKIGSRWDCINYVDCFAGPWRSVDPACSDTSFGIAVKVLAKCQENLTKIGKDLRLRFCFIESDKKSFDALCRFRDQEQSNKLEIVVLRGEFEEHLAKLRAFVAEGGTKAFRFLLVDPKGWTGFALKNVAPLLETRSAEVLVTMMTYHIRRFVRQEAHADQFDELFADKTVAPEAARLDGVDRERFLVCRYAANLKRLAGFSYISTAAVFRAAEDTVHYYLVFGTNSPHGIVVFKEAERVAFEAGEMARGEAKTRKRVDRTGQPEFDLLVSTGIAPSEIGRKLRATYNKEARAKLDSLIALGKPVSYDSIVGLTLESPLVWEQDVQLWIDELLKANRVTVVPSLGRKRLRIDSGFVVQPVR